MCDDWVIIPPEHHVLCEMNHNAADDDIPVRKLKKKIEFHRGLVSTFADLPRPQITLPVCVWGLDAASM